jgi:ubiquinone biosynthesis protein COQ9
VRCKTVKPFQNHTLAGTLSANLQLGQVKSIMTENIQTIRDRIIEQMLPTVPETGWSWAEAKLACARAGYQDSMAEAVFPGGMNDVVAHFSCWADRKMLDKLKTISIDGMRVRDRVRTAIMTRFELLEPMKPVVRAGLGFWAVPTRVLQGQRVLWRTADRIWDWAGDTATDYNRQTKRALLCSILLGSSMVWIEDESEGHTLTAQFVDRRIENVMEIGKAIGTIGGYVPNLKRQTS